MLTYGPDRELHASARHDKQTAGLMTNPGIRPVTVLALQAFTPPMESFRHGRRSGGMIDSRKIP